MDDLRKEHGRLAQKADYSQAIHHVQAMIDQLTKAREAIVAEPSQAPFQLAKTKPHMKEGFDKANDNLKQVNSALKGYEKALGKTFKTPFENPEKDALSAQSYLINRAIAMHLLREGQFDVASTFFHEVKETNAVDSNAGLRSPDPHGSSSPETEWERKSDLLQKQFAEMYTILDELRNKRNLDPAINWAKTHSHLLEGRGSNLEFELCRLRYVSLFLGYDGNGNHDADIDMDSDESGRPERVLRAAEYAREAFGQFSQRYTPEIHKLLGAMAYWQNIPESPYGNIFASAAAWDEVCHSFTREFCSLLGLSSSSPLYIACTAGSIALPRLSKFKSLTKSKRTEWTTEGELPVEIPLPPSFRFHSIFVCPVSKEQGTDSNPPMMLPCGHVICKDSLKNVSKGARFKCPYCPLESHPREARQVYL